MEKTANGWVIHYKSHHNEKLRDGHQLKQLRWKYQRDWLPSPDMNTDFGLHLSRSPIYSGCTDLEDAYCRYSADPVGFDTKSYISLYRRQF